ncbi:MAG: hypothetical protein ACREXS_14655 [Gammaproteobacteria bacterium]
MKNPFCEKWGTSSDSEWLSRLIKSIDSGTLSGVDFPKWILCALEKYEIDRLPHVFEP